MGEREGEGEGQGEGCHLHQAWVPQRRCDVHFAFEFVEFFRHLKRRRLVTLNDSLNSHVSDPFPFFRNYISIDFSLNFLLNCVYALRVR